MKDKEPHHHYRSPSWEVLTNVIRHEKLRRGMNIWKKERELSSLADDNILRTEK